MAEKILQVEHLKKSYDGKTNVLDDISFGIEKGEVVVIVGPSGCGKSTFLRCLNKLESINEGALKLDGQNYENEKKNIHLIREKIGMVFQSYDLFPNMSIMDNLTLAPVKAQKRKKSDVEKEAEKLFTIIRKLRSEGKGIIYITHRMEEIFQIADRLTVMRDGTYIGTVKASETSKDEIIKMMVGRDMSEQYPKDPTEKGEIALKVENLTYTPPEGSFRRSLKNISLYVRHGEVLGIAGLAGAGRSELFECLAGVHYKDTTAKIFIDGKEVIIKNPADAIKAGISFATEDRKGTGLVLQRSIGENMSLPLLKKFSPTFFMKSGEEKKEWNKQMETLRIKAPGTKTLASALSGGNQQKVVLGRWLMTEPKILLLDEPTRGIDVGAKAEIYQLINNLAKQGMAIIVVSSELPEVIGISDRIVTFCEGELTGEYLQEEATQEKLLQSATK